MQNKLGKLMLILTLALCNNIVIADDPPTPMAETLDSKPNKTQDQNNQMMEKCHVVDSNGNGLIKPYMADSGINLDGDASAWIWVPYGQCSKINKGDFSGVSEEIRQKIDTSNIQMAPTLE